MRARHLLMSRTPVFLAPKVIPVIELAVSEYLLTEQALEY